MDKYQVTLTFTEPLLGTVPKNKYIYASHIADKAALNDDQLAEELESVEHIEEKGWTGFHLDPDGRPFIYDYAFRGLMKEACGVLRRVKRFKSAKLTAYKKVIDGLIFVFPRRVLLDLQGAELGVLERPLRAQTAQGERVALARSDFAPPGTTCTFEIHVMGVVSQGLLEEWLNYGSYKGMGQWRSGGYGRFDYELEALDA